MEDDAWKEIEERNPLIKKYKKRRKKYMKEFTRRQNKGDLIVFIVFMNIGFIFYIMGNIK